jgi:large subunit ribosomal protein L35
VPCDTAATGTNTGTSQNSAKCFLRTRLRLWTFFYPPSLEHDFGYNNTPVLAVEGKMPKQKSHKGIKKRFRVTATGKAMHRHSGTSHLAYRLTKKRRRNLRGTTAVAAAETSKIVQALLPAQ